MPRPPRTHGTAVMYKRGPSVLPDPDHVPRPDGRPGCYCAPCRTAASRRSRQDAYLRETGRSRYVAAGLAREHVQQLLDSGMSRYQIAGLTGGLVDRTQIRALMVGQNGKGPSRRIRRVTEAALLAVPVVPASAALPDRGTVPAVGTVRRIQALLAAGYRLSLLAGRLGIDSTNLWTLLERERVLAVTARKVRALYAELEQHTGDPVVAARYQAMGFLHPGWWDPHTLDDPAYQPAADVPGGRLDRADRRQERRDTVAELIEQGLCVTAVVAELRACGLLDATTDDHAAMRAVERDKQWWRSRGRSLPVAA
jgi:hypothetical protein